MGEQSSFSWAISEIAWLEDAPLPPMSGQTCGIPISNVRSDEMYKFLGDFDPMMGREEENKTVRTVPRLGNMCRMTVTCWGIIRCKDTWSLGRYVQGLCYSEGFFHYFDSFQGGVVVYLYL